MLLNKHGSFYIRNGWPTKIMNAISTDHLIFSPNNEMEAVDTIGVGRVMVKAMRYWSVAMGLAAEEKTQQGVACNLTDLGNIISINDPFCQDKGSLWLLHRNLATNEEQATAWYWAFNVYNSKSFSKDDFCSAFYSYIQRAGGNYQKPAVDKEFDCFKNTYVSDKAFDVHKIIEEDTVPFFAPLRLLEYNAGVFERTKISAKDIPTDILLYCIMKDNEETLQNKRQLSIDTIKNRCENLFKDIVNIWPDYYSELPSAHSNTQSADELCETDPDLDAYTAEQFEDAGKMLAAMNLGDL